MIEVTRSDLVGQYVGQTAPKTLDKIKEAYGGVLFIDEAYSLNGNNSNDFGKEALSTLIKEMEDNRDKLVVIMEGYQYKMKQADRIIRDDIRKKEEILKITLEDIKNTLT